VGSVIRRRRISRPSVVGRTISALGSVDNRESACMGEKGCALGTPLAEGSGTIAGRRLSRCFRVPHISVAKKGQALIGYA
jgi:hypothetical protein